MKRLLFASVFLASSFLQASIYPAHSTPLSTSIRLAQNDPTDNLPAPQLVQQTAKNVTVRITSENNGGSGVIIAKKGDSYLILTNAHVVRQAGKIAILAPDGQKYQAESIDGGFNTKYDLALLQFTSKTKYALANLKDIAASPIEPTRKIYSSGFPFDSKDIRITSGEVSQLTDIPFDDGTQIGYVTNKGEKGIRQGMSGGAIFDVQGNFLGINTVGIAPILPNYTYSDGSKPIPKLAAQYTRANWGIPVYNFLTHVKADILYGYDNLRQTKVDHQTTPTGYMAKLNDKARKMTVRIENSNGNGSGVIVAKEGNSYYVLTAKHVVQDENSEKPTHQKFTDGQIITYDQDTHPVTSTVVAEGVDLAVIKFTSSSNYPVSKLGKYNIKDEDLAFVGGFPGRNNIKSPLWQWQLNPGFIFSKERGKLRTQNDQSFENGGYDLIYGSISYGGMSGGPVFDTKGNVIGIHGEAERANLNSLGISIQTFIGLATKLQVTPNLLAIDPTHPSNLTSTDRQNVIATMQNIPQIWEGDDGQRWLDYANQLYRTRQYDKSIAAYDRAIINGKTLDGNYAKAVAFSKAKKFDLATVAIDRAIAAAPTEKKDRAIYYYLWNWQSIILNQRYKYDEALKSIDMAIDLNPGDPKLRLAKASNLFGQRRYAMAITTLDDIIRIKPEWYLYAQRAISKTMQGDHQGSIADANTVIKLNPEFENTYVIRASTKFNVGDFKGAIADLNQAIKLNPNSDYAYQSRARIKNLGGFQGAMVDVSRAIQINPENPGYYDLRAEIKDKSNDYKGAIEDVNRAIQIDPYYYGYYTTRGRIKSHLGDNRGAIIDYDRAIKIDPNEFNTYYGRGTVKLDIGDNNGALKDANRAIEINPRDADIYSFRGEIKRKIGDRQGAMNDYDRAIVIDPKKSHSYARRGSFKSKLGDYRGAISDYTKAIEVDSKNNGNYYLSFGYVGDYYSSRGDAKAELGDKEGALNDYRQSIKVQPKTSSDYTSRGRAKSELGDYRGAIDDYTKAIELDPKNSNIWNQRAVAKLKIADYRGAIIDFNKAIELDPKNTINNNVNNYALSAIARKEIGDKKGAIYDFTKAIEFNTKRKDSFYFYRGVLKLQLGDNQGATDDYTQAIKFNPQYADAYNQRATIKLQSGDNRGSIDDYTQAIKLDPKNSWNYILRGAAKSNLGDRQGALADIDKSIILNPKYADAYISRGDVKSQLGNKQEAILDYDKSIELNPKNENVYISRSVAKFELGDNAGAIMDTNIALKLNPNSAVAYANRGAFLIIDNKEKEALPDLERAIKLDPKMSYAYAGRGIIKETFGDKQGAILDYKQAIKLNPQLLNEWKKQAESVRKYNTASYQKYQQMIQKLEAGSKLN